MPYKYRGKALIIVNLFEDNPDLKRTSASKDYERMATLFRDLDFSVTKEMNVNLNRMEELIHEAKKWEFDYKPECFVCVISSHGNELEIGKSNVFTPVIYMEDAIGQDRNFLYVYELMDHFSKNCAVYEGIPKLFFIQACRTRSDYDNLKYDPGQNILLSCVGGKIEGGKSGTSSDKADCMPFVGGDRFEDSATLNEESSVSAATSSEEGVTTTTSTSEESGIPPASTNEESGIHTASTIEESGIPPASTNEESGIHTASTSEENGIPPASTNEESGISPVSTSEESGIPPASTNEESGIPPVSTSEESGIPPASTNEESGIQTASTSEGRDGPTTSTFDKNDGPIASKIKQCGGHTASKSKQRGGHTASKSKQSKEPTASKSKQSGGPTASKSNVIVGPTCSTSKESSAPSTSSSEESAASIAIKVCPKNCLIMYPVTGGRAAMRSEGRKASWMFSYMYDKREMLIRNGKLLPYLTSVADSMAKHEFMTEEEETRETKDEQASGQDQPLTRELSENRGNNGLPLPAIQDSTGVQETEGQDNIELDNDHGRNTGAPDTEGQISSELQNSSVTQDTPVQETGGPSAGIATGSTKKIPLKITKCAAFIMHRLTSPVVFQPMPKTEDSTSEPVLSWMAKQKANLDKKAKKAN